MSASAAAAAFTHINQNRYRYSIVPEKKEKKEYVAPSEIEKYKYRFDTVRRYLPVVLSTKNKKIQSIEVTQSTGKKTKIDVPDFKIKLNIDGKGNCLIYRWGSWRKFDPFGYIIEVNLNHIEDGINPFTGKDYKGNIEDYHTILRKLKINKEDKQLYYDMTQRTFYKNINDDCEKVGSFPQKGGSCEFIFNPSLLELDLDHFKFFEEILSCARSGKHSEKYNQYIQSFIDEFDGVMDEMIDYGGFFGKDIRNLAEEYMWGTDPDKMKTRENYKIGGK